MAKRMQDVDTAVRAVQDPRTSADDLALIAYYHPQLRAAAAAHPNAYPATRANLLGGVGTAGAAVASQTPGTPPPPTTAPVWEAPPVWPTLPIDWELDLDEPSDDREPVFEPVPTPPKPARQPSRALALVLAGAAVVAVGIAGVGFYSAFDRELPPVAQVEPPPVPPEPVPPGSQLVPTSIQVFGGSSDDMLAGVAASPHGAVAIIGSTSSLDGDFALDSPSAIGVGGVLGFTQDDNVAWTVSPADTYPGVTVTPDGNFVVTGRSSPEGAFVAKYAPDGGLVWQTRLDGMMDDGDPAVLSDGSIIVGLDATSRLVKLSADGDVRWTHDVKGLFGNTSLRIAGTPDGGVVAVCSNKSTKLLVVKLDSGGNVVWQKNLGGSTWTTSSTVRVTPDGTMVIAGATESTDGDFAGSGNDAFVAQLTPTGEVQWYQTVQNEYGLAIFDDLAIGGDAIAAVGRGGLVATFDLDGTPRTEQVFADGQVEFWGVAFTADGDIAVTGVTKAIEGEWAAVNDDHFDAVLARLSFSG